MIKIGIDIGGTSIKGIRFEDDVPVKEFSIPTPARSGRSAIFCSIFGAVDALDPSGAELIGVSSAGNIDPNSGVCVYATENLFGWTGADIRGEIEGRYHVRVQVDNDAICALKGELRFYPGAKNVTMLTFGTGIGGASLVNGEILRGKNFDAARWGHTIMVPSGLKCSCGKRGCAESYLSATGLVKSAQKKMFGVFNAKQIFDRYSGGEPEAQDVIERFGGYLNVLLDNVRTVLAPELILLGGGLMQSEEIVRSLIEKTDDVAFARLGAFAGAYGAVV